MLKLENKVRLVPVSISPQKGEPRLTGKVESFCFVRGEPQVIVRLDQGFYDPTNSIYISIMVVHETNLEPIE
jgi:hypothetical protein